MNFSYKISFPTFQHVLGLLIGLCFSCSAFSQSHVLLLKNGSIIKCDVLEETDEYVKIVMTTGDTMQMGYKHVDRVVNDGDIDLLDRQSKDIVLQGPKYHKTTGTFVNLDLISVPFSVEVGKRMTPTLNVGGVMLYGIDSRSNLIAIGPYIQKYLSQSTSTPRAYVELYGGIGFRTDDFFSDALTKYPPVGGFALGFQIPNRKKTKIYFEMGLFATMVKEEFELNDPFRTRIVDRESSLTPYLTLLGLQF